MPLFVIFVSISSSFLTSANCFLVKAPVNLHQSVFVNEPVVCSFDNKLVLPVLDIPASVGANGKTKLSLFPFASMTVKLSTGLPSIKVSTGTFTPYESVKFGIVLSFCGRFAVESTFKTSFAFTC